MVLEPTSNAWLVLAQWFRLRGVRVVMVPTNQSADLRSVSDVLCKGSVHLKGT